MFPFGELACVFVHGCYVPVVCFSSSRASSRGFSLTQNGVTWCLDQLLGALRDIIGGEFRSKSSG